jgi:hypothetical protein
LYGNTPIQPNFPQKIVNSQLSCEFPAPTDFQISEAGSTWLLATWTPAQVIPPNYRLRTFEVVSGVLVNTMDVLGGNTFARILNLNPGVLYRVEMRALCSEGNESDLLGSAQRPTLILELVVSGFSMSCSTPGCVMVPGSPICEFNYSNGSVTPFRILKPGQVERKFYISKPTSNKFKVEYNTLNEPGSPITILCTGASANQTQAPPCSTTTYLVYSEGVEIASFEVSDMSTAASTGKIRLLSAGVKVSIAKLECPSVKSGGSNDRTVEATFATAPIISPNPFTNHLNIQLPTLTPETPVSLALYDLQGRLVATQFGRDDNQMYTLSTENLKPGMYFLRIEAGGEVSTTKVVKTQ